MNALQRTPDWPYGYGFCHCGCGQRTLISPRTHTHLGLFKGEPRKWVRYHHAKPVKQKLSEAMRVDANGCWNYTGYRDKRGYGYVFCNDKKRPVSTHRASYEIYAGPIPKGLELDHLCRNPSCFNPAHLEPVTHQENILRGEAPTARNARKSHCRHGHPFDESNTYVRPDGMGRDCLTCRAARTARLNASR